jgi:hypothetical protein
VSLPHLTRLSTKIVRACPLVDTSLPFPVRDAFANPRELISGVRVRIPFFLFDVKIEGLMF